MGSNNQGPVDTGHNKGLQDGIPGHALPIYQTAPLKVQQGKSSPGRTGSSETTGQRGGGAAGGSTQQRLSVKHIPSTKKGWRSETGNKPKTAEYLRSVPTLQDGRYPDIQKSRETGRLAGQSGFEGRVLRRPDGPRAQEIPVLCSRREDVSIYLPTLRPNIGTMGLYQDPETGNSSRTGAGHSSSHLHRRHSADGRVEGTGAETGGSPGIPPRVPGLYDKQGEDGVSTVSNGRVPGFQYKHANNGNEPATSEIKNNKGGVPQIVEGGANLGSSSLQIDRQDDRCRPSDSTGSTILQTPADGFIRGPPEVGPELRHPPVPVGGQQGGTEMVGHGDVSLEWEDDPSETYGPDNRVRCLQHRLGSNLPGDRHRGTLVSPGKEVAHQLPRTPGSNPSIKNICKRQEITVSATEAGQHIGSSLYKQPGRDHLETTGYPDPRPMDVVPGEEHTHPGSTPAGGAELHSRQGVQGHEGSVRLEVDPPDLQVNRETVCTTGSGPICIPFDQSVPTLLQLAARSLRGGNRCLPTGLVEGEGFCQPPVEFDNPRAESSTNPRGGTNYSDPPLEIPTMVCPDTSNAGRLATPPTTSATGNPNGGNVGKPTTSRVEHIRESLKNQGLSEQATNLITKSWRTKTTQSYDSLFKRWDRWCSQRGCNPFSGPVSEVANFLASLFEEGYQYSSVNAYRSAISSVHDKVDGFNVGQHPTIVRLVKGVFNCRPPLPRYSTTWDVQKVLDSIESGGQPQTLPIKALTLRAVFLLAITRPSRSADLSQLNIRRMSYTTTGVSFLPTVLAKQSRQGKPITDFFFPSFPDNQTLCPVSTLKVYLDLTKHLRGEESRLFISFIKPHKAVTSSSIARWLKTILEEAGIDTSVFGAHSTRGASASAAAKAGITTADILKTANWSSESVFQRFYHKSSNQAAYGRAVINQNSSE